MGADVTENFPVCECAFHGTAFPACPTDKPCFKPSLHRLSEQQSDIEFEHPHPGFYPGPISATRVDRSCLVPGGEPSELSKTTLFSLMLKPLQFPAPDPNPPLYSKGNTRGLRLRLRKMEELGWLIQSTIPSDFTEF